MRKLLPIILLLISFYSFSQSWSRYYSFDTAAFFPIIYDVEATHDGEIFLLGSELFGNSHVIKADRLSGDTIWTKADSSAAKIMKINGSQDYYILRSDGFFGSNVWICRVDSQLNTIWKVNSQLNGEFINDFTVLSDGSAFCYGTYFGLNFDDIFFKRVDQNGNVMFLDSLVSILPSEDLFPRVARLPNDEVLFFAQDDFTMRFYRFDAMGSFLDSAQFPMPGRPDDLFVFKVNPYDPSINVMGYYEIDTTNLDTMDFAGYFLSLDMNYNIRYQSMDTTTAYMLDLDFFSADNSARVTLDIDPNFMSFDLGFFSTTNQYLSNPLGTSPNFFPNFPFIVEYIGSTQIIVAGTTFESYWAASFPTFINNLEEEKPERVKVFPNPATDVINFNLPERNIKSGSIQLVDLAGNSVLRKSFNSSDFQINCSELGRGMYFYVIQAETETIRGKFIIE